MQHLAAMTMTKIARISRKSSASAFRQIPELKVTKILLPRDNSPASHPHTPHSERAAAARSYQDLAAGLPERFLVSRFSPKGAQQIHGRGSEAHPSRNTFQEYVRVIKDPPTPRRHSIKPANFRRTLPFSLPQSPRHTDSLQKCACLRPKAPRYPPAPANSSRIVPATHPLPATSRETTRS
jgi:hypothetical protein